MTQPNAFWLYFIFNCALWFNRSARSATVMCFRTISSCATDLNSSMVYPLQVLLRLCQPSCLRAVLPCCCVPSFDLFFCTCGLFHATVKSLVTPFDPCNKVICWIDVFSVNCERSNCMMLQSWCDTVPPHVRLEASSPSIHTSVAVDAGSLLYQHFTPP